MKLTKSKQFLADAIHASGKGWRVDAKFAIQDADDKRIWFTNSKPELPGSNRLWGGSKQFPIGPVRLQSHWSKTILSRDEYFSAYPAEPVADADGWIEWNGGDCPVDEGDRVDFVGRNYYGSNRLAGVLDWENITQYRLLQPAPAEKLSPEAVVNAKSALRSESIEGCVRKPTIEQLAQEYRNAKDRAERKQQEADEAKAATDAALGELVAAGKAIDLVISIAKPDPEPVITDWRDLLERDTIWFGGDDEQAAGEYSVLEVEHADYGGNRAIRIDTIGSDYWIDVTDYWKFIRRP